MHATAFSRMTSILPIWYVRAANPVILLANKCEGRLQEDSVHEAYRLGLGEPIPFSAEHGLGLLDLYEALKPFDKKRRKNRAGIY